MMQHDDAQLRDESGLECVPGPSLLLNVTIFQVRVDVAAPRCGRVGNMQLVSGDLHSFFKLESIVISY